MLFPSPQCSWHVISSCISMRTLTLSGIGHLLFTSLITPEPPCSLLPYRPVQCQVSCPPLAFQHETVASLRVDLGLVFLACKVSPLLSLKPWVHTAPQHASIKIWTHRRAKETWNCKFQFVISLSFNLLFLPIHKFLIILNRIKNSHAKETHL